MLIRDELIQYSRILLIISHWARHSPLLLRNSLFRVSNVRVTVGNNTTLFLEVIQLCFWQNRRDHKL